MGRPLGAKEKKPRVTPKQKAAVDAILTGKSKTMAGAMRIAGYSESSTQDPGWALLERRGVEQYLKSLSELAQKKWGLAVPDKVGMTMLEGLEATKFQGEQQAEHPDWDARFKFAESLAKFYGLVKDHMEGKPTQANQYNFFTVGKSEQKLFNENFRKFLGDLYKE